MSDGRWVASWFLRTVATDAGTVQRRHFLSRRNHQSRMPVFPELVKRLMDESEALMLMKDTHWCALNLKRWIAIKRNLVSCLSVLKPGPASFEWRIGIFGILSLFVERHSEDHVLTAIPFDSLPGLATLYPPDDKALAE
jgi:hypothetical protein